VTPAIVAMAEEKAGVQGLEPRSYDAIERDFQEVTTLHVQCSC